MSETNKRLICGVNWLGDSVMSMPAIQLLKQRYPSCRIAMLVKPELVPLWNIHSSVDEIIELHENPIGTLKTATAVKKGGFDCAFVFPNSFRSALIPFLARIPIRIGMPGHQRAWMLSRVVGGGESSGNEKTHQAWEYVNIMGLANDLPDIGTPCLSVPEADIAESRKRLNADTDDVWVGIMPGAAYGPSKRWPAERFGEIARRLTNSEKCRIMVLGTAQETALCSRVAEDAGKKSVNLAGQTSLPDLAAMLGLCRVVITNDSGGMHLAAAAGAKVVAVFGLTDPARTGPLGTGHRVILQEGLTTRSRDIERNSPEALESMLSIAPEQVYRATVELLA